jgi:hypothetical protein
LDAFAHALRLAVAAKSYFYILHMNAKPSRLTGSSFRACGRRWPLGDNRARRAAVRGGERTRPEGQ